MVRRSVADVDRALRERDCSEEYLVEGLRVGRLWLDQGFALELHPSAAPATDGALLRLYLAFRLRTAAGEHALVAHDHGSLVPALALLGRHAVRAFSTPDAAFELHLDDGAVLAARSLDEADYWEFVQPWRPRIDPG